MGNKTRDMHSGHSFLKKIQHVSCVANSAGKIGGKYTDFLYEDDFEIVLVRNPNYYHHVNTPTSNHQMV